MGNLEQRYPGADAESPTQIPPRGWWQVLRRAWAESKRDQISLLAAGVAFYEFLALFPLLIALTLVYGLVTTPAQVQQQVASVAGFVPASARQVLLNQLTALAAAPSKGLGIGLVAAVLGALWGGSSGASHLMNAVNIAYDEQQSRGFVRRKAIALALTLGGIVFFAIALAALAAAPALVALTHPPVVVRVAVEVARWLVLLLAVVAALAVLYRYAPDRDSPQFRWTSVGATVATILWILASIGFSLYASFGSYTKTYGSLAGVAVLLMWLWLTTYAVLLGAEVNAEAEQQTVRDTTKGAPQPLGRRHAVKADSMPGEQSP